MIDFERYVRNCLMRDYQKKYLLSLTEEQRAVVQDESQYALVTAAAGSGKTRVLVAKYLWLTRVIVRPYPPRILYLSYNFKNVEEAKIELRKLGIPKSEVLGAASTFHSLALKILAQGEGAWPRLLEGVKEAWDESWKETWAEKGEVRKINHDAAEVFLKVVESKLDRKKIEEVYTRETRKTLGLPAHRYVCYSKDRNDIPGSCRSEMERDIFRFLVNEKIDFAYEEYEKDIDSRIDFTIYFKCKNEEGPDTVTKIYYEHFTADNEADIDGNISPEAATRYAANARSKIAEMTEVFGERFFYTKSGDDFKSVIRTRMIDYEEKGGYGSCKREIVGERGEKMFNGLFQDVVTQFKDVRSLILELKQDIDDTLGRIRGENMDVDEYMDEIFLPLEEVYRELLVSTKPVGPISDFADSLIRAAAHLHNESLRSKMEEFVYDWVLVDEYQDISPARLELLKGLRKLNPELKILAVGDDWQTINSFSGSDIHLFRHFGDDWKGYRCFPLSETFRFGGKLLDVSTKFARTGKGVSGHEVYQAFTNTSDTEIEIVSGVNDIFARRSWQSQFIHDAKKDFDKKEKYLVLSRYKPKYESNIWMTMHKSKGKTVDYVFVYDCKEGTIPSDPKKRNPVPADIMKAMIRGGDGMNEYEEERRLFYVALTRARKKVWLLYPAKKEPSPFIKEIREYLKDGKRQ